MLSTNSVSFVMTAENLITVEVGEKLSRVRQLLAEKPIHHIPVLERNKLVGIISTTDFLTLGIGLRFLEDESQDTELDERFTVARVMETSLVTLHPRDSLRRAAEILTKESFNSLPVVDEVGELVGILTTRDLLRFVLESEATGE
jgi:CBS domain-containing membrane protein